MNSLAAFIGFLLLLVSMPLSATATEEGQLYAVLINGGRNRLTNHERYWNDCAFLYRTLRNTYHVPQRNIFVLMSDGGAPDRDMLKADGTGFISSPADLDGDGQWDLTQAATRQAVVSTLDDLSRRLTPEDRLFLFVMDHGGSDDEWKSSFLWLWNDERLSDQMLASLLNGFNRVSMSILMGQCYSGGFLDDLSREGRVVATACSGGEQSWACTDRAYDEFVYHWTCAVNGADEAGNAVVADENGDGFVSMKEAFDYARSHDRRTETPCYASWPEQLGEQWTLSGMVDTGITDVPVLHTYREVYTPAGIRRQTPRKGQVSIVRQGGQYRKIVR